MEASVALAEKDRIKREITGKVHAALKKCVHVVSACASDFLTCSFVSAEKTQKELASSAVSMRSAFQDIGEQLGGVVEAQEIKEDLDTIRACSSSFP